jgi:hypothetical protein
MLRRIALEGIKLVHTLVWLSIESGMVAHLVGTSSGFSRAADGRWVDYLAGNWTLSDPTTLRIFGVVWVGSGSASALITSSSPNSR